MLNQENWLMFPTPSPFSSHQTSHVPPRASKHNPGSPGTTALGRENTVSGLQQCFTPTAQLQSRVSAAIPKASFFFFLCILLVVLVFFFPFNAFPPPTLPLLSNTSPGQLQEGNSGASGKQSAAAVACNDGEAAEGMQK